MRSQIEQQIKKLGIILPSPPAPVAAYVPYTISGNLVFISGQVCFLDGDNSLRGKLGKDLSLDQGYVAARNCALNAIAHLKSACKGDLDIVSRCISIRVFIACSPDFSEHPKA